MEIVVPTATPGSFPVQSAGRSPALSTEDLPLPDGPITARKAVSDKRTASSATSSSRPKNQSASSGWNASRPLYGQGPGAGTASSTSASADSPAVVTGAGIVRTSRR